MAIEQLATLGVPEKPAKALVSVLCRLASLPQGKLASVCLPDGESAVTLSTMPAAVVIAVCYATTAEAEIRALVCDLPQRDRELILARWGFEHETMPTLEDMGSEHGITRERVRQIVQRRDDLIRVSGIRLPYSTMAVEEIDGAGGALPDGLYSLLLKYGQADVSRRAMRAFPALALLGAVPQVSFHQRSGMWLTALGAMRWQQAGGAAELINTARRAAAPYQRRIGAIPLELLDQLSPFGREHALHIVSGPGGAWKMTDSYAVLLPLRSSVLLRQCRKTLNATGPLSIVELRDGLVRSGFRELSDDLLVCVLEAADDLVLHDATVALSESVSRESVLAPAERIGFDLLKGNGGAMLWWDFNDGMREAGFSTPMANVVLRKPAVRPYGPAAYALRGKLIDPLVQAALRKRRRQLLSQRSPISRTGLGDDGSLLVDYVLNRFAVQGVLPAPMQLIGQPRIWTAHFPDGSESRLKVANGFIWPLHKWFEKMGAVAGDALRLVFDRVNLQVTVSALVHQQSNVPGTRDPARTREQQMLDALFGDA